MKVCKKKLKIKKKFFEDFLKTEKEPKKIQWFLQDLYTKTKDDISNIEKIAQMQVKVNETKVKKKKT